MFLSPALLCHGLHEVVVAELKRLCFRHSKTLQSDNKVPLSHLQDTTLEQQLITAGADPQQAKDTIAAFQAASAGSSRHLLQDLTSMVAQAIDDMQAGLDPVQARNAVLAGSSGRRHLLQVGSMQPPTCFSCSP